MRSLVEMVLRQWFTTTVNDNKKAEAIEKFIAVQLERSLTLWPLQGRQLSNALSRHFLQEPRCFSTNPYAVTFIQIVSMRRFERIVIT